MKAKDLLLPAVVLGGVYLVIRQLSPGSTAGVTTEIGGGGAPDISYPSPSGGYITPVTPTQWFDTPLPPVSSEPDVSQGIPPPGNPVIPLCPTMIEAARFPGDTQLICQCPSGNIQGGNPYSMNKLMLGTAPEDYAWRARFCGL